MRDSDGMELFESYLRDVKRSSQNTISSYLRDIRQLSEYLHAHTDADLGSAEEEELCEYIDWMRSNGKSVATVSRAIASLKNFYGFLLNNHYVQHNPTGKLVPDKAKQKLPQILSSKEVELLLAQPECTDAKGYRDRAMLELLYATGIRVSELPAITAEAARRGVAVVRCKGKSRRVLIPTRLQKKQHRIAFGPVFVTRSGAPLDRSNIWREMKALCRAAGVSDKKVFPHNFRHLFARTFYRLNKDLAKLADLLGHSSINTTRIYIRTTSAEHRRCLERMRLVL